MLSNSHKRKKKGNLQLTGWNSMTLKENKLKISTQARQLFLIRAHIAPKA